MILIVDSGTTKADWTAINDKGERLFETQTLGLNPEVLNESDINERITNNYELCENSKNVKNIFFYGAGCSTERSISFLKNVLEKIFVNADISVKEDTFAAVYATTNPKTKAIVCIIGTGSNCSLWDGEKLVQAVDSLGYIVMDECSGNFFGKQLLSDYYFKKMPDHLCIKFEDKFDLDPDAVKNHLYKLPNPNGYLATFGRFLIENKNEEYCQDMFRKGFQLFIDHWITQYDGCYELPINFVGSIAFYMEDIVREVLEQNNMKLNNIIRKPIDGLVVYHLNK